MINNDRIVSVTNIDLISLYGLVLKQDTTNNSTLAKLAANAIGEFQIKSGSAPLLAAEPAKIIDIDATASSVSACTFYFVAAYDYKGISIDGTIVEPADGSDDVVPDGTLYKAVLATGAVTITKVGF